MDFTVCCLLFCVIPAALSQMSPPSVWTPQGRIYGRTDTVSGAWSVNAYMGIPYAKPPVRFQPPQNVTDNSSATINATNYRPACPQTVASLNMLKMNDHLRSNNTSEDCLTLNVYVPTTGANNLPVMVWIHGGGFVSGSGSSYDGRLLATKQVIVVTINYRLGLLGFFPNGKTESTLGLQDQIMALQWVHGKISYFGGNPKEVTIFGESAGGISVSFLSMSPKANGLFKRVIAQSGVATSALAVPGNAQSRMDTITKSVREKKSDCPAPTSVLQCLSHASLTEIIQLSEQQGFTPPTVDNDVVLADYATNPYLVHPRLEFIVGTLPNDGAMTIYMSCTQFYTTECDELTGMDVETLKGLGAIPADADHAQSESLTKHYNSWYPFPVQPGNMNIEAATKLLTDRIYKIPANKTATQLQERFKVRVYEFDSVSRYGPLPTLPWSTEAQHTDELPFLFKWITDMYKDDVSDQMLKLWTDFAKGTLTETTWPLFTSTNPRYLFISDMYAEGETREPYFQERKNAYWRHYFQHHVFPPYEDTSVDSAFIVTPALPTTVIFTLMVALFNYRTY